MRLGKLKGMLIGLVGAASALTYSSASATIFLDLQNNGTITTFPTSMQQAIDDDFYFIFDSWYPVKDTSPTVWAGGQVELTRLGITVQCRLQLGGYLWVEEGAKPRTIRIAVTHGTDANNLKPSPDPAQPNSAACASVSLRFNNGFVDVARGFPAISAGAWTGALSQADLDTMDRNFPVPVPPNFGIMRNVQVHLPTIPLGGNCSTAGTGAGGTGGEVQVRFNNNGVGIPASFDFDGNIGGHPFLPCHVRGKVYSVLDKTIFMNPDYSTPSAPNPSPTSYDKVDAARQ